MKFRTLVTGCYRSLAWTSLLLVFAVGRLAAATSPQITCPSNIVTNTAPDTCGRLVAFAASATGDPEPVLTYTLDTHVITSPYLFPTGTNVVTATATNGELPD